MREIEHLEAEPAAAEGGGEAPAGGDASEAAGAGEPGDVWVAVDLEFTEAPDTMSAGETTITLINNGELPHNVTFPDISDSPAVDAAPGETAEGIVELEPGTYEYICSIPGHENTMNGELTVE